METISVRFNKVSVYHLSVYNTIIRSLENSRDCEFTPLPAYLVGESSFWCQEDYYFDVSKLSKYYDYNKAYLFSLEGGEKEYNYLKTLEGKIEKISSKELFSLHHSVKEFKEMALNEFKGAQNSSKIL